MKCSIEKVGLKVRARLIVSGRVQGVFFRAETEKNAKRQNVTGWVQNLPDGRVEALLEGEKENVDSVIEFCKRGPRGAHVDSLNVTWGEYAGEFAEFTITHNTT
jgi:acylphosphatase